MYVDLDQYLIFLLVMLRMTGMLVVNPIFGRRNIPTMLSMGLSFVLAILITSSNQFSPLPDVNLANFMLMVIVELAVGILAGFVLRLFMSAVIMGGEIIDMQLGLGMAKMFDPGTNASVSLHANMLNTLFVLIFFVTNNHLTFIRMTAQTFRVIPPGGAGINPQVLYYIPDLFSSIFLFAIKLCLPLVVIELIVTIAVGIIMRIVPQINIFVVNIQFKLLIGLLSLVILVGPFMAFLENLIVICFDQIKVVWGFFVALPG